MHRTLVMGAGKIGSLIATLLTNSNDYQVFLAENNTNSQHLTILEKNVPGIKIVILNALSEEDVTQFIKKNNIQTVISCLPYHCNIKLATIIKTCLINYFDLTEDIRTTQAIKKLAESASVAFVPQCGLAPGFISIVANHLMKQFPSLHTVKMRVGALPVNISNALQYSLTWSTDGLINEYGNLCHAIIDSKEVTLLPLDDLEEIKIDGLTYEAFNTSGGIGSLANTWQGKVRAMTYKTIRYPGHCKKIRFLMNDLQLNHDRVTLKTILEKTLPKTTQDVVLVYVSVTGIEEGVFLEKNYVKKFYPLTINNIHWSAIQLTTASSLCAVLDETIKTPEQYKGFVLQEQFSFDNLVKNRFGKYYAS